MNAFVEVLCLRFGIVTLICIATMWAACAVNTGSKTFSTVNDVAKNETDPHSLKPTPQPSIKTRSFDGIQIDYDQNWIDSIEAREEPEYVPPNPEFLPDTFVPPRVNFTFTSSIFRPIRTGDYQPEINIYSIEQFKRSANRTRSLYSENLSKKFQDLRDVIDSGPNLSDSGQILFVPWSGGHQAIQSHKEFVSFKNGRGVVYLTEFTMDVDIINNAGLYYVFQGLTDDNKYFVVATFPIRSGFLPVDSDADTYEDYHRPIDFFVPEYLDQNMRDYEIYLRHVENELEQTKDESFHPDLHLIRALLTSILIKQRS